MDVLLSIFGWNFAEPPSLFVDRPRYSVAHVAEESNEATIQKLAGRIKYALRVAFGMAAAERLTDCATPSLFLSAKQIGFAWAFVWHFCRWVDSFQWSLEIFSNCAKWWEKYMKNDEMCEENDSKRRSLTNVRYWFRKLWNSSKKYWSANKYRWSKKNGVQLSESDGSFQTVARSVFLTKFDIDTPEKEPRKVCGTDLADHSSITCRNIGYSLL